MYRDGYLVLYENDFVQPQLVFCVLGDGVLSFYNEQGGENIGNFHLTGHVIKVQAEKPMPHRLPHRFSVTAQAITTGSRQSLRLGSKTSIQLCAPSSDLMKDWANSVHLWKRMNWKENVSFSKSQVQRDHENERSSLNLYIKAFECSSNSRNSTTSKPLFRNRWLGASRELTLRIASNLRSMCA